MVVSRRTAFNYKEADFNALRRSLSLVHWGILDALPVNDAVDMFYSLFESAIVDHVSTVTIRVVHIWVIFEKLSGPVDFPMISNMLSLVVGKKIVF